MFENSISDGKRTNIMELFSHRRSLKIGAPMVRYSKLQFRTLLRKYGADLCFTPMIMADSFWQSEAARQNEFTTSLGDSPLVVQFAANNPTDFVRATNLVAPYCDGVDLNAGCPQRWAKQMKLGCSMLNDPQVICDIVKQCRSQVPKDFTVSVKTRILSDLKKSVDICRQIEKAGASFLTIHGRTPEKSTGDVNKEAIKLIVDNVDCPVVANGGINTFDDCNDMVESTNCAGVMVASGLLTNPALYLNYSKTPTSAVQDWMNICYLNEISSSDFIYNNDIPKNVTFQCFHHHLVFMLEKLLSKEERRVFNNLKSFSSVVDFIHNKFGIIPDCNNELNYNLFKNITLSYDVTYENSENCYKYEETDGQYFKKKACDIEDDDDFDINKLYS